MVYLDFSFFFFLFLLSGVRFHAQVYFYRVRKIMEHKNNLLSVYHRWGSFIYSWFSLFVIIVFYQVALKTELVNTTLLPLGETQGSVLSEPLVIAHSSTDQHIAMCYVCFFLKTLMANFMCQLDWARGAQILGQTLMWVCLWGFPDDISIWTSGLTKADCHPPCGCGSSNQMKAWIEQQGWVRRNSCLDWDTSLFQPSNVNWNISSSWVSSL